VLPCFRLIWPFLSRCLSNMSISLRVIPMCRLTWRRRCWLQGRERNMKVPFWNRTCLRFGARRVPFGLDVTACRIELGAPNYLAANRLAGSFAPRRAVGAAPAHPKSCGGGPCARVTCVSLSSFTLTKMADDSAWSDLGSPYRSGRACGDARGSGIEPGQVRRLLGVLFCGWRGLNVCARLLQSRSLDGRPRLVGPGPSICAAACASF
jgi:hypothetical protein